MVKRVESPSSINTFKQCPRKYYYQYIAGLPVLPNVHQVRGSIAHATLENFYDVDISSFTEENYSTKFREAIQKLFLHYWGRYRPGLRELNLNKDQEKFYFEETMLMLMNWTNQFLEEVKKAMAEKNLSLSEAFLFLTPQREQELFSDRYSVRGFIDAVHQLDEEIHLIDYKTNSNLEVKESIRLQLAIYSLLYFEKYGKMPTKVGIFFLRHKVKLMKVDEELLELAKKEIELIHQHTSRTENILDYPQHINSLCKWGTGKCDFYGVCQPFEEASPRPPSGSSG